MSTSRRRVLAGRTLFIAVSALLAVLVLAIATGLAVLHGAQPSGPGAFYRAPSPLPGGPPGTIIRTEVVHGFPGGAKAWRVLYVSTSYNGHPAAVSGLIIVPNTAAPPGGRDVVAWAHPTVGIASNCAPSQLGAGAAGAIAGLEQFLAAGDVIAATDYQGLGTAGPHPYLVGASEAMGVLDSVRAAHNMPEAHAGTRFAVWGHSQGGQAALFTGQLAASYAPELQLAGVAAAAPPTDLKELFQLNLGTTFGDVLAAFAMRAWEQVYDDPNLDQVVTPAARPLVRRIAKYCLQTNRQALAVLPAATILKLTFLSQPPWQKEPWATILSQNTPGAAKTGAPILITQGGDDSLVHPPVNAAFARQLCDEGESVAYRVLAGVDHSTSGLKSAAGVAAWIADRFAGKPPMDACSTGQPRAESS